MVTVPPGTKSGPGPAQIWRISGQFGPKNDVISKKNKQGFYRNSNGFSGRN